MAGACDDDSCGSNYESVFSDVPFRPVITSSASVVGMAIQVLTPWKVLWVILAIAIPWSLT